jgi:Na+-translocating ferredoxin:NAD+ oxidoreductase RnfD subunit
MNGRGGGGLAGRWPGGSHAPVTAPSPAAALTAAGPALPDGAPAPRAAAPALRTAAAVLPAALPASRAVAPRWWRAPLRLEARWYQIAVLAGLLAYGTLALGFDVPPGHVAAVLGAALLAQWAGDRLTGRPRWEPRSALISALGLCVLLRANEPAWVALAAALAVGSKFALRVRDKHVFNPTNFAMVTLLLVGAPVWVSPGQWGSAAIFAFALAAAGGLVVNRAARADVTWAFLGCWAALLVGRALWLGDPLAIPLHRLQNGTLVMFAFLMISDPRTTPDSRAGRLLFAALVAAGAFAVQFALFRTNGLLWSLYACSLLVPLIDRLLPGPRYAWGAPGRAERTTSP